MSIELDLMVARLMGWNNAPNEYDERWIVAQDGEIPRMFTPSSSANHADLVLDRIAALGWAVTVFTSGWHGKTQIRCCIMRAPGGPAVDVVAETRPLAICRAFALGWRQDVAG